MGFKTRNESFWGTMYINKNIRKAMTTTSNSSKAV